MVRSNKMQIEVKRLVFMDAVEEAIGRGTEMDRPIFMQTGSGNVGSAITSMVISGVSLLGYVARECAIRGTQVYGITANITHMPLMIEAVKSGFSEAGKEDFFEAHEEELVRYVPEAHLVGLIRRDRPAATIFCGPFWSGVKIPYLNKTVGAMTLGGTARIVQTPFYVTCCDYPLIGEEVLAVGAYLTKDPIALSALSSQDYWKILCMILMFFGAIAITFGSPIVKTLLTY
jgi:hypothetical protein